MRIKQYNPDKMNAAQMLGWFENHGVAVSVSSETDLRVRLKAELAKRQEAAASAPIAAANMMQIRPLPVKLGGPKSEPVYFDVRVIDKRKARGRDEVKVTPLDGKGEAWISADRLGDANASETQEVVEAVDRPQPQPRDQFVRV